MHRFPFYSFYFSFISLFRHTRSHSRRLASSSPSPCEAPVNKKGIPAEISDIYRTYSIFGLKRVKIPHLVNADYFLTPAFVFSSRLVSTTR